MFRNYRENIYAYVVILLTSRRLPRPLQNTKVTTAMATNQPLGLVGPVSLLLFFEFLVEDELSEAGANTLELGHEATELLDGLNLLLQELTLQ